MKTVINFSKKTVFALAAFLCLFSSLNAQEFNPEFENPEAILGTEVFIYDEAPKLEEAIIPDHYVVLFNTEVMPSFIETTEDGQFQSRGEQMEAYIAFDEQMRQQIIDIAAGQFGINPEQITQVFTGALTGFSVKMDRGQAEDLGNQAQNSELISCVVSDVEMGVDASEMPTLVAEAPNVASQYVDWGVRFTGSGDLTGSTRWAFVLDTGVDMGHSDLNTVRNWSRSFISGEGIDDYNGHGTHVAGIIAAKNNNFGTKGVAAGASVVSVKVLGANGKGSFSSILKGVSYAGAVAWRYDVLNLSLGGPKAEWWHFGWVWGDPRPEMEKTLARIGQRGKYVVIAAGNDTEHAKNYTPARVNGVNVFTISNMTSKRELASDSNHGNAPIDFAAPGSLIWATYKNNKYARLSGTSMAAPHVAGILLVNKGRINTKGRLVKDRDGRPDLIAVK